MLNDVPENFLNVLRQVRSELWEERKNRMNDEGEENLKIVGMSLAHDCVTAAFKKAYDALDFMWDVHNEANVYPKPLDVEEGKVSFARGVLVIAMQMFEDEYFKAVERAKNV